MQRTRGIVTIIAFALLAIAIPACGKPGTGGGTAAAPKNAPPANQPAQPAQPSKYTTVSGNGQPFSANLPVAVEPRAVDFGIVEPGSAHRQAFTVTNLGTTPLTLVAARTSCKCTTLTNLDGKVIAAGGSLEMPTELVLTARPGEKTSYVQLVFNTPSGQRAAKVDLRAVVELPVRAQPPYVDSLKGVTSGTLLIDSGDGQPFTILSTNGEAPQFADGFNPGADAPRDSYVLRWSTDGWPCDGMRKWLIIETDRADCPILPCRIRHECSGSRDDPKAVRDARGWYFSEQIVNAGALPAGQTATLELELVNTSQKPISGVMSLNPSATAKMISAEPSGAESTRVTFEFTPKDDYDGMLYALINVLSPSGNKDVAVVAKVTP